MATDPEHGQGEGHSPKTTLTVIITLLSYINLTRSLEAGAPHRVACMVPCVVCVFLGVASFLLIGALISGVSRIGGGGQSAICYPFNMSVRGANWQPVLFTARNTFIMSAPDLEAEGPATPPLCIYTHAHTHTHPYTRTHTQWAGTAHFLNLFISFQKLLAVPSVHIYQPGDLGPRWLWIRLREPRGFMRVSCS